MSTRSMRRTRGSALVSVLLVLLVLTVVGLGIAYFTQVENRLSGNDRVMKTSFYAAEAGLKAGERWINDGYQAAGSYAYLPQLVQPTNSPSLSPPGGGQTAYLLVIPNITAPSFDEMPVDPSNPTQGTFTLYVRHDRSADVGISVNLISVGKDSSGYTRILEEQLTIPNLSTASAPSQGGGTPGGAGSVSAGAS